MDLDAQVDLRTHRFTQAPHIVDRRLDLVCVRFVIWRGLVFIEQRIEVPERREPLRLQPLGLLQQRFDGASLHVAVDPSLVPHLATQQFVDRHAMKLPLDVPQRDVDRGNGTRDRRAGEVIGAQHDVPMVLDRARIFAHQIFGIFCDRCGAGLQLTPGTRLADAGDARVGFYPDQQEPVDQQRLNFGDFHWNVFLLILGQSARPSAAPSRA